MARELTVSTDAALAIMGEILHNPRLEHCFRCEFEWDRYELTSAVFLCRGTESAVHPRFEDCLRGMVLLHNHPGTSAEALRPSEADCVAANIFATSAGVGFVVATSMLDKLILLREPERRGLIVMGEPELNGRAQRTTGQRGASRFIDADGRRAMLLHRQLGVAGRIMAVA